MKVEDFVDMMEKIAISVIMLSLSALAIAVTVEILEKGVNICG